MTHIHKNIYNIPSHLCFVDTLADYIVQSHDGNDVDMSDTLVLLPTRRAITALQDAFVRMADGKPVILPRLSSLGEVDEDELLFMATELGADYLTDTPSIHPLKRRLVMAKWVNKLHALESEQMGDEKPSIAQTLALSDSLCTLLDQIHIEQADIKKIKTLVPEAFDGDHWKNNLKYLSQIVDVYPPYLEAVGLQDGMIRRNELLKKQAGFWQRKPPTGRIIIAGSTGTMPATADLMKTVSSLPNNRGAVILPGIDMMLSSDDANVIISDPAHPQYGLMKLLNCLDVQLTDVKTIGDDTIPPARQQLLMEMMRPASMTHLWDSTVKELDKSALDNVTLTECDDSIAEARTIALLMRDVAQQNIHTDIKKTCTLVTPDRNLSRQVLAILKRWGIDADDSAGVPLDNTKQGIFLRLIMWVVRDDFSPIALLSLLKHPLMNGGQSRSRMRTLSRALEYTILRGVSPTSGLSGLYQALQTLEQSDSSFDVDRKQYIDDAKLALETLTPLKELSDIIRTGEASFSTIVQAHIKTAEQLARTDDADGECNVWQGDVGDALAILVNNAREHGGEIIINPLSDYETMMQTFMAGTVVRTHGIRHPRLKILGAIESRMIKSDIVILGGLNEGTWPPTIENDHWLSRPMRADLGLPPLERHISLSAHDFVQAFSAKTVHITRAKKVDSQPTVPSRWIDRMNAIVEMSTVLEKPKPVPHVYWQSQLDDVKDTVKLSAPSPTIGVDGRIRQLSSTDLEKLFINPYAVYAKKILKLHKLDEPEQSISVANVGTIIHGVLEDYVLKYPIQTPDDVHGELLQLLNKYLEPYNTDAIFMANWKIRYERMIDWLALREMETRKTIVHSYAELDGKYVMHLSTGNTITLTARADRVNMNMDGLYTVIDYKTGGTATKMELRKSIKPQLLLASKILSDGSAKTANGTQLSNAGVSSAQYWSIKGQDKDKIEKIEVLAHNSKEDDCHHDTLAKLIDNFTTQSQQVLSYFDAGGAYTVCPTGKKPRYDDYEHLSRIREWSVVGDNDDGGDND